MSLEFHLRYVGVTMEDGFSGTKRKGENAGYK